MPVQTKTVRRSVRPKGATFGSALAGSAATTVETVGKDGRKSQALLLICFERTPQKAVPQVLSVCVDTHINLAA